MVFTKEPPIVSLNSRGGAKPSDVEATSSHDGGQGVGNKDVKVATTDRGNNRESQLDEEESKKASGGGCSYSGEV